VQIKRRRPIYANTQRTCDNHESLLETESSSNASYTSQHMASTFLIKEKASAWLHHTQGKVLKPERAIQAPTTRRCCASKMQRLRARPPRKHALKKNTGDLENSKTACWNKPERLSCTFVT